MVISYVDETEREGTLTVKRNVLFGTMNAEHPESLKSVGQRLEIMRVAMGYAHKKDFAEHLGITPQTLNHYLKGNADMPYDLRQKLWKMGAHPGWLYHGDEDGLAKAFIEKLRAAELIMDLRDRRG